MGLKVLVVEDDPDVMQITSTLLEAAGHVVLRAMEGREALSILDAHEDIDLLFTDIVLPGSMDGFDIAEAAKLRRPRLHVIYTSGYLRQEGIWNATLLRKPWSEDDLKDALAEILPKAVPGAGSVPKRG